MKKIILPTDFSENAYNAIKYASKLYKNVETTFYLLNTYTPAIYQSEYILHSPSQIGLGDIYQESSLEQLEKTKSRIENDFKNPLHSYKVHSAFDTLVHAVSQIVKNEGADLVIMGTQGATGAQEILFGTNTVHVIKKAECPVIAIPSKFEYETPKEILFPTDYEIDYAEEQFEQLLDIAKMHLASIEIIHAATGYDLTPHQQEKKQKLDAILSKVSHLFHDLPNQTVINAINNFQLKKRMNFLVMIQNKHTFLERLFIEPVIKKIGFHVNIPFMVIPQNLKLANE